MGNTLKYMFISIITSVFIIFIIWFALLVENHPSDFMYYHLDLEKTFSNFTDYFENINLSIYGNDFTLGTAGNGMYKSFVSGTNKFLSKAIDFIDNGSSAVKYLENRNSFLSFALVITGIGYILRILVSFVKLLLLVVYLVLIFINCVALGINFIIALGGAISQPYFTLYIPT